MSETGSDPAPRHVSVLPDEVLHYLAPKPGDILVDATVGAGGHALRIAERLGPTGRLIGLDQDGAMLDLARRRLVGLPVTLVQANFAELPRVLRELAVPSVSGVLADLGFCSDQLDDAARGLSFNREGPLDMRLNPHEGEPACDLLRWMPERDLADLIWRYGEERHSRRIARRVMEARRRKEPLETTGQLAELVRGCVPWPRRRKGEKAPIDPATRVFQALRIAVNDELGALDRLLSALPSVLEPGGKAVVISFHSLEDRRVKQTFRNREVWNELTRKPVTASEAEVADNPRARSAKLRAARSMDQPGARVTGR